MKMSVLLLLLVVSLAQGQAAFYRSQWTNPLLCTVPGCFRQARTGGLTQPTVYQIRPESTLVLPTSPRLKTQPKTPISVTTKSRRPQCSCVPHTSCPDRSSPNPNRLCLLASGYTGICCHSASTGLKVNGTQLYSYGSGSYPAAPSRGPTPTRQQPYIRVDLSEVNRVLNGWKSLEREMAQNHIIVKPNTVQFAHANFFGGSDVSLLEATGASRVILGFTSYSRKERLTVAQIVASNLNLRNTNLASSCGPAPVCDPEAPYRTADGTCNNLVNGGQGKAVGTFARLLPAEYADGISQPKVALDGGELPNARLLSITISPDAQLESEAYSLLLMQFGQFVDHDLTRTAVAKTQSGGSITCCDQKVLAASTRFQHPACFSITVPPQDDFLKSHGQTCIDFVRSAASVNPKCRFGPREQLNQLSAYLDGNNIYGASEKEAHGLRQFTGGLLKITRLHGGEFLPQQPANASSGCQIPKPSTRRCFHAGDGRVNEVLDLSVLHTVWLREHNRLARSLARLNPGWSDELLYQETKRLVVAQFQHIIYAEFLPLLLGPRAYQHFELGLSRDFSDLYDPQTDASILNEWSTAAYRLHTLVAGVLNLKNPDTQAPIGKLQLRNLFSNPELLYEPGGYELRLNSLTEEALHKFDNFFTRELTNHLFQIPGKAFGLDLVALNIQRGRDHGLPGYVKYRELCGLSPVSSFADLRRLFSNPQVPEVMEQLYGSVGDIDLFLGGSAEKPMPRSVVGPTFACIIGEQFKRIKEGDRFWYENGGQAGSFTRKQLAEIKKTSMARILCDNSGLDFMQPNAFLLPDSRNNPKLACDGYDIPRIDLEPWSNYHK